MRRACKAMLVGGMLFFPTLHLQAQPSGGVGAVGLLETGFFAYQSGEYQKASRIFQEFLAGYGDAPAAKQAMDRVLRLLSLSLLQQKKFEEALPFIERYLIEFPSGDNIEEMVFWRATSLFQQKEFEKAFGHLETFATTYPQHPEIQQIWMMAGMSQLSLGNHEKTLEILGKYRNQMTSNLQGRIFPVILYCHFELEQWDELIREIREFDPYEEGMISLSSVNLLAIQTGTRLIEQQRYRDALVVLQKAWPQARIVARQEGRLNEIKEQLRRLVARSQYDKYKEIELQEVIAEVERDLERVKKIENYDTALQFRIARCFYDLDRFREAYLVLQEMVDKLPVSDLLLQANYQMLISLTKMERWREAVSSADVFAERFPESKLLDNVLYLKGEALMRLFDFTEASLVFNDIVKRFPDFGQVERCHFLAGYCLMMVERNMEAVEHFKKHLDRWPRGTFREQVIYWEAMAFYYDKQYDHSREIHGDYLKEFPKGQYAVDSQYRRAHGLFGQENFLEAYKELEAFLKDHPEVLLADEARNLLGDCYFAMGEIDRGLKVYRSTTRRDGRLYDYAQFRIGKALKSTEEYEAMREHFETFLVDRPGSPRLTEALSQLAWIFRKDDQPEAARELYWNSIVKHGNDPEARGVEEMMTTLAKYYRGDRTGEYDTMLAELADRSARNNQPTLGSRALWMRAQLKPRDDVEGARRLMNRALEVAEPIEMSARVLADVADSLRESGEWEKAEQCYRTILFWYPRSMLKDRSYAGLGLIAQQNDQPAEALRYYDLFERETVESPLWADVLESRAKLYQSRGDFDRAIQELERILEIKSARGKPWVQALYQMGEIRLRQGNPKKAIPYFQRIYIMYGRWSDYVAKAYWESGQAFEALNMRSEAVNTYREFAQNTHLKEKPEYERAVERLNQMGEPLQPPAATPEEGGQA